MKIQGEIIGLGAVFLITHFVAPFLDWPPNLEPRDAAIMFIILGILILAKGLDELILTVRQIKDKTNNQ